ncbi:hypothetical protein EDF73_105281 [Raoultella sp. BIGb0138]|uniref:hypothetical protein n=1 Tax=Raoultella sp. BIGb0138 TaxID=2485115 RepID=UPI00104DE9D0|nr:hypothetical protein [Raoultella sp. BIGb0138]TCW13640.1 hypothetical protein EDF73_105281 [Raoultella sp. BIGb0138]
MLKKLPFIIPPLALIALLAWWLTPHYSAEDEAYYRSVFCVIDRHDSGTFLRDMENIVEGGNSDYALHKTHFIPALAERMRQTWLQLSQEEQDSIREDQQRCRQLMSEKQQG